MTDKCFLPGAGHWQEYHADKTAALCRRSYAEGGVQLMETNLQLDSILRYGGITVMNVWVCVQLNYNIELIGD